MIILNDVTYAHPNKDILFDAIHCSIPRNEKIALVGKNGVGKSTLLKIFSGNLVPISGSLHCSHIPYYLPQIMGQFNYLTIAQALLIDDKINALHAIINGNTLVENFTILNDDWGIEERCEEAFDYWKVSVADLNQNIGSLSGGQKTKVLLAGAFIHQSEIVLLDEPSNHLDVTSRALLYRYIETFTKTMVVVSHDRTLLNLLNPVYELQNKGLKVYGGSYDFYISQKEIEVNALEQQLQHQEKEIRKAKELERTAMERQQKLDARGRKKQEKSGLPTIMLKTYKNSAEQSTAKMKDIHAGKIDKMYADLVRLREEQLDIDKMKIGFENAQLHTGKQLFQVQAINFNYKDQNLWENDLSLNIQSGARVNIEGDNGSGKTTLIKLLLGKLTPSYGKMKIAQHQSIYVDQDYSLIDIELSVYEQAVKFNTQGLQEHEIKIRLNRFLFSKDFWHKSCLTLSGGEKMRLLLCCLNMAKQAPEVIILDEPTNNLDVQSVDILTNAIKEYNGTLIVVSHDIYFLSAIDIRQTITLSEKGLVAFK